MDLCFSAWRRRMQRPFLYSVRSILTLKEGNEEFGKASYDILLEPPLENKSKESGAGDTEMTLADSFTKASGSMPEKRKHKAMGSITEENGSVEQRKTKREKKINALIPSSNEHYLSSGIAGGIRAV
ncbi:hypothetical protein ACJW31_09G171500 [Castanea mollissima]